MRGVSRPFGAEGYFGGWADREGRAAVPDAGCGVLKLNGPQRRTACASRPHSHGCMLAVGRADPEFLGLWRARMRSLRSPALLSWRHELRCTDDGEGRRHGGDRQPARGARGRAAPGGAARAVRPRAQRRVAGAGRRADRGRAGRPTGGVVVLPAPGDEPYAFVHVRDRPATDRDLKALGIGASGTRVTVPLSAARLPAGGSLARAGLAAGAAAADPRGPGPSDLPGAARPAATADQLSDARAGPGAAGAL